MNGNEIRERFLSFFEERGHRRVSSSSLIPANDPTLLFANAGMNQFKDLFTGAEKRDYTTACSSQKCVRAGGKHNDLDNVGYTARHNTFFEMLGNFSFGDYFKKEAIRYAWDFLTQELKIPIDRLYVTVYLEDDEAFAIWRDEIGVAEERIFRFGKKDNFWSMGDTGPCGPCSEIFYDYGDLVEGPADPYEAIESGSDKIVEVWNLVFMQFNAKSDGTMEPLPNPSIDTGMGLERISTVVQHKTINYDIDLFADIITPVAARLGVSYGAAPTSDTALRVIADHLRAMSFLITDGVTPSNEGRGYVLRRIMRRAMRYAKQLGQTEPVLHQLIQHVVAKMGEAYPDLIKEQAQIELLVKVEEQQFETTLNKGMPVLTKYLIDFKTQNVDRVPGQVIHLLYGTHGFPVDLMADIARDYDMILDLEGYQAIMDEEAKASQAAGDFKAKEVNPILVQDTHHFETEQTCYDGLHGEGVVKRILVDDQQTDDVTAESDAVIVLDSTAFYAESGGQIGDRGLIRTETGVFEVSETTKVLDKLVLHHGRMTEGTISQGQVAHTEVEAESRRNTMKNHTATHLLHQALRDVLGLHVRQAGSLVDPDKLRFDFSHFAPVTPEQITAIENLVNEQILADTALDVQVLAREEAMAGGAIAFFGEKYGEEVRVVGIGEFSKEFCGGTHVRATGEIGAFKIIGERGLAAGVRRLIGLTGPRALERFQESETLLQTAKDRFFLNRETLLDQLQQAQDEKKALVAQIEKLKMQLAKGGGSQERIETVGDFKVMLKEVSDVDGGQLRNLADELLGKIKDGAVLLGSNLGDKAQLIVKTNRKDIHAGKLVGQMATAVGGKGGGRPDMAMAGGKEPDKIAEALEKGLAILQG